MSEIGAMLAAIFLVLLIGLIVLRLANRVWKGLERDPLQYKDADELATALLSRGPDSSRPLDAPPDYEEDVADVHAPTFGGDRRFNAATGQIEGPLLDDPGEELDDDELSTFDTLHGYDPDYDEEGEDYEPDLGLDDESDPGDRDWRQRR